MGREISCPKRRIWLASVYPARLRGSLLAGGRSITHCHDTASACTATAGWTCHHPGGGGGTIGTAAVITGAHRRAASTAGTWWPKDTSPRTLSQPQTIAHAPARSPGKFCFARAAVGFSQPDFPKRGPIPTPSLSSFAMEQSPPQFPLSIAGFPQPAAARVAGRAHGHPKTSRAALTAGCSPILPPCPPPQPRGTRPSSRASRSHRTSSRKRPVAEGQSEKPVPLMGMDNWGNPRGGHCSSRVLDFAGCGSRCQYRAASGSRAC